MDVGRPLLGDAIFPDESLVFSSRDFDAVRAGVARIFKPHLLRLHGTGVNLQARMHHLRQGNASVNRLEYGAEVEIDPERLDDFFLVQIPVAGHASIACGNRRFELDAAGRLAGVADFAAAHALACRQRAGLRALRARHGRAALRRASRPCAPRAAGIRAGAAARHAGRALFSSPCAALCRGIDACSLPRRRGPSFGQRARRRAFCVRFAQRADLRPEKQHERRAGAARGGRRAAFRAARGRLYPASLRGVV